MNAIVGEVHHAIRGIASLRARWKEEKDFEDFAEYIGVAKRWVESTGSVFGSMTKRFDIKWTAPDGTSYETRLRACQGNRHYQLSTYTP